METFSISHNKNDHIGIGPTTSKREDIFMNIYWLVFQDLVELIERGGMHELGYEFLMDIVEMEIGKGTFPKDSKIISLCAVNVNIKTKNTLFWLHNAYTKHLKDILGCFMGLLISIKIWPH